MGYYSIHNIYAWHKDNPAIVLREDDLLEVDDFKEKFEEITSYTLPDAFEEDIKWYDCEEDMKKVSLAFPDYYFVVNRVGEEHCFTDMTKFSNDVSCNQFKNGLMTELPYEIDGR